MSITVKDTAGAERNVASKGLAGTALGLGAGALGLQLLNGGTGINLGGVQSAAVSEKEFYLTELSNRDREFANYNSLNDKICQLAQRISVDETAIAYQNKLVDKQFDCVDTQFANDRLITKYQIGEATCNVVRATPMLRPEQIGDPYHGLTLRMGRVAPEPYCGGYNNGGCGGGWNGYNNGGCGGGWNGNDGGCC